MLAEQFPLANGEQVAFTPGLLEVRDAGGSVVRAHTLGAARGVRREGQTVHVEVPAHGQVTLEATSPDDAVAIERALRTAILAAPDDDGGWDDLFAAPPAATPPAQSAPASTPTAPAYAAQLPTTPQPMPTPTTMPASSAAQPAASSNTVVLASGYIVEVTPQQVIVRHQAGHAVSDLPTGNVLNSGRSERTVSLDTSGGTVNLIAASEQDAARLLALIDASRSGNPLPPAPSAQPPAPTPATWTPTPTTPATTAAGAGASSGAAGAGAGAGSWASAGAGSSSGTHTPDIAPLEFRLPSGYRVSIASEWIVVHTAMGNVANSVPMADVIGAEAIDTTVHLRTMREQFNFITASAGDAHALATTINSSRRMSPHPQLTATGTPGKSQGLPTWAIVAAVIIGFIIFSNILS